MSSSLLCAIPQASDIAVNPIIPTRNIRRRPTMSPSRPEITSPIANASVYAARIHCRVLCPPPISRRMEGPAMLTMVASSRSMTSAARMQANTTHRNR
jgi:hypothetical protein